MMRHGHLVGGKMSPTYFSWRAMMNRCRYSSVKARSYTAQGVAVCERWKTFVNFLDDMGNRPEGYTLGRKNHSGNYEPGNVIWQRARENFQDKRDNKLDTAKAKEIRKRAAAGETYTSISKVFGVHRATICRVVNGQRWPERE